jgi:hypothetical protein
MNWLVGIIEIVWRHVMELWESQNNDKHGINAGKEAKAKPLLLPRVRGFFERHSHLPLNATEALLDVDLATREQQTAGHLQWWLLIAEPCLKQQEKAVKEQEKQRKKHPAATHQDPWECIFVAPKLPARCPPETQKVDPTPPHPHPHPHPH